LKILSLPGIIFGKLLCNRGLVAHGTTKIFPRPESISAVPVNTLVCGFAALHLFAETKKCAHNQVRVEGEDGDKDQKYPCVVSGCKRI
jgi:hypothetical protein